MGRYQLNRIIWDKADDHTQLSDLCNRQNDHIHQAEWAELGGAALMVSIDDIYKTMCGALYGNGMDLKIPVMRVLNSDGERLLREVRSQNVTTEFRSEY